ncbi:type IV toxin-antitoxin system AbiEi family antitoxin domain-containing protein [Agromyces mangrovi Wang et al. 2018]|uniref:type IV toxin-antitoxin system AbiEi family antitoxin domain-containing protein n=1 Tax=Agromyces mangrovi TaxID=1858653 RepID=UPI00257290EC|nr:type IV toxin-antitoxin system AbiEi family antitoxin domain-containing protein [Agromyces mangrovi]BDZ65262.1 hypothetical protein GCM10025877_22000 [Agromyces mangrovi]
MADTISSALERLGEPDYATTAQLRSVGVVPDDVALAVRRGRLIRLRRGAYVDASRWAAMRPEARHAQLVRATSDFARTRTSPVSHLSAAAMHGLPIVGRVPRGVHVWSGSARGGSSSTGLISHRAGTQPETTSVDGIAVTSLARTVVDVASTEQFGTAVCVLDSALGRPIGGSKTILTTDMLVAELDRAGLTHGRRAAERAIGFADQRSGSPGESWSRAAMHELGFVVPDLQVRFEREHGHADVDYYWRSHGIVGEFDGNQKYARDEFLRGRAPADVVVAEKRREDELRRRPDVRGFVRWDWRVARSPRRLAALLDGASVPRR